MNSFECKSTIREIQKNIDQIRTSFSRKTQRKRKKKSVASSEPLEDYSRPQSQYKECSNGYLSKDCTENNNLNHIETFGFHGNIDSDYRSYLQSRQEHPKYSSAAYLTPNIENTLKVDYLKSSNAQKGYKKYHKKDIMKPKISTTSNLKMNSKKRLI